MRFIVDEMPTNSEKCPFGYWKPYPPCFEEAGRYICILDNEQCNRYHETECQWMVQLSELLKGETP